MLRIIFWILLATTVTASAGPVAPVIGWLATTKVGMLVTGAWFNSALFRGFVQTIGLSLASSLLGPKIPKAQNTSGYELSGVSPAADHAIIYGRQKVGGVIVFKDTTRDNKDLHLVIALAGHEIESVEEVYLNDAPLTFASTLGETLSDVTSPDQYAGKVYVTAHLGSDDQTADQDLIDASPLWDPTHRLRGIAYLYVKMEFEADSFPQGEPSVTAIVKGKKVYNPNTGVTEWTDNASYILRDYLVSDYGVAVVDDEIDDISFTSAANICDEPVSLAAGGTEARYTINGSFVTSTTPDTVIDKMTKSMAGSFWYAQGKFRVKAGAYVTPTVTFDEDDLRTNVQIQTRRSRRENYNIVAGEFRGDETGWIKTDYPEVRSQEFIDVDNGQESRTDLDLPFTTTSSRAQRIAKILLYRNRQQLVISATFGLRALQVQVGDVVMITNSRAGWAQKPFEVLSWSLSPVSEDPASIKLELTEISSDVYLWQADERAFELDNTNLADAFFVPSVGLSAASIGKVINEHVIAVLRITVSSGEPERTDYVEVQFKKSSEPISDYVTVATGDLGSFEVIDIENGVYDIRARAVNTFGVHSEFEYLSNFTVETFVAPPQDVLDFHANVTDGTIALEWTPVADLDLSYYRIRHAVEEVDGSWSNSTTSVDKVARPANSVVVPARAGTYTIKAYDKLGHNSDGYSSVVISSSDIASFSTSLSQAEQTAFSGAKTNCSVTSSQLRITDTSSASLASPATATYEFSNYIDTGAVRIVRSRIDVKVTRFNSGAGLWDDIPGLWDTWEGSWDGWTDTLFADHNVVMYISATNDDPAGTPTWSDYKLYKSGDFSGRAFRFKIQLISQAAGVSPSISELTARVEYN
tara:strand:+ start:1929 stop:4529 length:2601 start_codon:yes stop_codon:yes gene_type:complete